MTKHNGPTYNSLSLAQLVLLVLSAVSMILRVRAAGLLSFIGLAGMYLCGLAMLGNALCMGQQFLEYGAKHNRRRTSSGEGSRLLTLAALGFYGLSSGLLGGLAILGFALGFTPNPTVSAVGAVVLGAAMLLIYTAGILGFAANKMWLPALLLTLLMLALIYTGARQLFSHLGIP
jgi:hypothetical protein